ncbi:TRAP transporter substrate-binding protein [Marinomonas sp. TI.3.20]|uniref:TRAP transporter substrate-binding protein n=1 Tax=Marinomonas sp. TI.3.20 TaxID=3121296 RepID=UPI00311F1D75
MKFKHIFSVTAALLSVAVATSSSAETIRVASWLPPTNPMNAVVIPQWGNAISKATNGRIKVEIVYGLGHPKTMWNLVEDGIVDASYSYHGYVPGRFELPQVVEQPGLGVNAEAASYALWKTYEKFFVKSKEFAGLKLLGLFTHGPGQIHSNFPVNNIKDLENKKIRIGGGVQTILAEKFHVTPVGAPATKVYEMMQQGVIDGAFLPVVEQKVLRLSEVTKDLTVFPGGLYMGSFSMFMNPDVFADLDKKDQAIINKVSGESLSVLAGKAWDAGDLAGLKSARDSGVKVNILKADSSLVKEMDKTIADVSDTWVKTVDKDGYDGEAALSYLKKTATKYAAEHKE